MYKGTQNPGSEMSYERFFRIIAHIPRLGDEILIFSRKYCIMYKERKTGYD